MQIPIFPSNKTENTWESFFSPNTIDDRCLACSSLRHAKDKHEEQPIKFNGECPL